MHYAFTEEAINKVLAYLGKRTYDDVADLINELKTTATPVTINPPITEPSTTVEEPVLVTEPITEGGTENV